MEPTVMEVETRLRLKALQHDTSYAVTIKDWMHNMFGEEHDSKGYDLKIEFLRWCRRNYFTLEIDHMTDSIVITNSYPAIELRKE